MDIGHPDFRNSIALDSRIRKVTQALGLHFDGYETEEAFYLGVAAQMGITG